MQTKEKREMCSVPISATVTVDRETGNVIDRQLEYADIPADAMAAFLLERFGGGRKGVKGNG